MANHLRELVECCERGSFRYVFDLSEEKLDAAGDLTAHLATMAVCFDAGEVNDIYGLKVVDELCRLPYECTWIEFRRELEEGPLVFGVMARERDGEIAALVWKKTQHFWCYEFSFFTGGAGKQSRIVHVAPDDDFQKKLAQNVIFCFRAFLSALNCTNVRRIEHKPDAKLQKARAKRGKQPLFSYWTLELTPGRAEDGQDLGGTHASPRLHLRRGHPRQYAPGKWTWVQPCVVGNKAAGMVHKDYSALKGKKQ